MSTQADEQRTARELWALPGGSHDRVVTVLKLVLPVAVLVVAVSLAVAPFTFNSDVSFVLDKNKVDVASERMKMRYALYRGEDSKGRPFSLRANSAVQKTSREPFVDMKDLSARILMSDGPATLTAQLARYNISKEQLGIVGPVQFMSSDGFRMETRDVGIDLKSRKLESHAPVTGTMPIGTFSANQMKADMTTRTFTLNGRANLRINQNSLKEHVR